ncbi:MAG: sulfatase [Opitutales bacterium]|jgi:arylsulfatase A|nr:sulfatase [Opitutales bacterium]MDG2255656.1 sulfatase [Opitutaceae bacterium]MBT5169018.1 sulfatase [Opitutales bacterium]MBT5816267.1 sulfatase [Opitutales bacterium]MBT6379464.1 sulfatase [Opitutales bacterium]
MRLKLYYCIRLIPIWLLVGCSLSADEGNSDRPPNVVFFLVDDLGWTDVGSFGSSFYETPHIDQFATKGVKFTSAYAACHVCSPTRSSILTGKYPARNRMTDWISGRLDYPFQKYLNVRTGQELPYKEETIAETLRGHGYKSAAVGKWHLGSTPHTPDKHGFDWHIPRNWSRGAPNRTFYAPYNLEGLEDAPEGEYLTDRLTDEAIGFIEDNKDSPFFLYMAHFAVHDPIHGRPDLVEKYEAKLKANPPKGNVPYALEGNPDLAEPLSREYLDEALSDPAFAEYGVLPQHTVKIKQFQDNTQFAGMVEAVDQSFGRIVERLEELGIDDNTIVIFFADNGGMAGMNIHFPTRTVTADELDRAFSTSVLPLRGAKGWLYEGGIRVPCIVKWPGQGQAGTVSDEPIISNDFYPSILEMAGLPLVESQHADGVSIAPILKGAKTLDRDAIYWHFPHYSNHGMQPPAGAIRAGEYKLLEYYENNTVQLFNLNEDIGEQNDLSKSNPAKTKELTAMLHAWRDSLDAQMPSLNPDYVEVDPHKWSREANLNQGNGQRR